MGRIFYASNELLKGAAYPGVTALIQFHFIPARPANLVITRDPESGELNLAAGTFGPLTDRPYTIGLHLHMSPHTTRNLGEVGAECVVALPDRNLVRETWIPALPFPRGISEIDIAELTTLPSTTVAVPGIAECPVNLECRVELLRQLYARVTAVFLRVVGASIEESMLARDRLSIISQYPTYEVDDAINAWGGSIERLGVNGELFETPGFPACAKRGSNAAADQWLADLSAEGYLSESESARLFGWLREFAESSNEAREALRERITHAMRLAAWERWDELHAHLGAGKG